MDLFDSQFADEKLHPSYLELTNSERYSSVLPILNEWALGLLSRKGEGRKFRNEFQQTFNSSMWEIYLNKLFIEMGFSIDYSKSSPDFCISSSSGHTFNVEAVITDNPYAKSAKGDSEEVLKRDSSLKLLGKIRDKVSIFRGSDGKKTPYRNLYHVDGKPFVVAIAPFDSDLSLFQNNELINLVLFGLDGPNLSSESFGEQKTIQKLYKDSGADVDVGIFTNSSYSEVSAVIFSTTGTLGKAVVASGTPRLIRSTRYRFMPKSDSRIENAEWRIGKEWSKVSFCQDYRFRYRYDIGDAVFGGDVRICHSDLYNESHFDGVHVYYNPFANFPLDRGLMWPGEFTHNFFDPAKELTFNDHPDEALVSRQLFDWSEESLRFVLDMYDFPRA